MTTTRQNLGPLTTAFTYPESCRVVIQACTSCSWGWQAQTCSDNANGQSVQDNPNCWPPRTSTVTETKAALRGWGVYSPGFSCPVGYTQMCSATGTKGFTFHFQPEESETAIGCCPTGYTCTYNYESDYAHTCYRIASTGSFPAVQCSSGKSNGFSYLELPTAVVVTVSSESATAESNTAETNTAVASPSVSIISTMILYAPLFELIHQKSDLPSSSSLSSSTAAETASSGDSSAANGLSTGAKAGIGAGVGAAVIIIILVTAFLFIRKRKRTRNPVSGDATDNPPKPELLADSTHPAELQGPGNVTELP